jgi:hypothetical protein
MLPIADTELCGTAHLVAGRNMTSPGQRPRHSEGDCLAELKRHLASAVRHLGNLAAWCWGGGGGRVPGVAGSRRTALWTCEKAFVRTYMVKTRVEQDPGHTCPVCGGQTEIASLWDSPNWDIPFIGDQLSRRWRRCANKECHAFSTRPPETEVQLGERKPEEFSWTFVEG